MLATLLLATLSAVTVPVANVSVKFTSDSVYKQESIVQTKELVEEESGLYTIVLEKDKLLGYTIYDKSDTEYIDGLKFDDKFVKDWMVEHVDISKEHVISVKTVYTEDTAGMLAAAKDGDWSRVLSNPLIIIQLGYYLLAAASIIAGGFGLLKSRKHKTIIADKVKEASIEFKDEAVKIVTDIVSPALQTVKETQDAIIKAFIMSQSGDKNAALGLIELLEKSSSTNIDTVTERIKKSVQVQIEQKAKAKAEAAKAVEEISKGIFKEEKQEISESKDTDVGGISI